MAQEEEKKLNPYIVIFMIIIGIMLGTEAIIFGYGMINADHVECSWWGCRFTDVREVQAHQNCTMNGEPINCSIIDDKWREFDGKD